MKIKINYDKPKSNKNFNEIFEEFLKYHAIQPQ